MPFSIDLTYRLSVGLLREFLEVINNSTQENRIIWIKKKKKKSSSAGVVKQDCIRKDHLFEAGQTHSLSLNQPPGNGQQQISLLLRCSLSAF